MATNQADPGADGRVVERLDYTVPRLTVPVPDWLEFTRDYEAAVPDLPLDAVMKLIARRASWSEMERLIGDAAPFGFLIYFRNVVGPVMELAGDKSRCTAYLMGNHLIAERMFRYDPRAMIYAPLHTVIWEDQEGQAWFTIDQPSAQFQSFGIPEVAKVGVELDHKVAALLKALSVPVPDVLLRPCLLISEGSGIVPLRAMTTGVDVTYALDGNAIAGDLLAVFGREMTAVVGRCGNCGTASAVAELCVYPRAPGPVVRCPSCHAVVMVLVTIGDECNVHLPALELQTEV